MMFFFCLYFYFGNKRLKQRVERLELETKEILERKIFQEEDRDLVSIQKLSVEKQNINSDQKSVLESNIQSDATKNKVEYDSVMTKSPRMTTDRKNNNRDWIRKIDSVGASRMQSFIANSNENKNLSSMVKVNQSNENNQNIVDRNSYQKEEVTQKKVFSNSNQFIYLDDDMECDKSILDKEQIHFDLNDFVQRKEKVVPNIQENKKRIDYLKDVSYQMAKELQPQTIELTDYEKDQEEHAVISYQELLALKDGIQVQNDEEDTIRFIDDLKKFKSHLS